jgi:hypothetical protein
MSEPESRGETEDPALEVNGGVEPTPPRSSTLGTGSALGIGCIAVVVLMVMVAIAMRWVEGGW